MKTLKMKTLKMKNGKKTNDKSLVAHKEDLLPIVIFFFVDFRKPIPETPNLQQRTTLHIHSIANSNHNFLTF